MPITTVNVDLLFNISHREYFASCTSDQKPRGLNGSAPIGRGTFSMDAAAYTKAMMRRQPIGILITAVVCASTAAFVLVGSAKAPPVSNVTLLRTPREGIQPQTVLDR